MLQLKVDGVFVDVAEDVRLSFELHNPMMEQGVIEGDYSLSFTLPGTPDNRRHFGYPELPNSTAQLGDSYSFEPWLDNNLIPVLKGTLTIEEWTGSNYRCSVKCNRSAFAEAVKDKTLQELDLEGEQQLWATATELYLDMNDASDSSYPTHKYAFPMIRNEKFYAEDNESLGKALFPAFDHNLNDWVLNTHYNFAVNFLSSTYKKYARNYLSSPQLYLHYVVKELFAEHGYVLNGTFFDDAEVNTLLLYNKRVITFEDNPSSFIPNPIRFNEHVPPVKVLTLLNGLANLFCLAIYINDATGEVQLIPKRDKLKVTTYKDITYQADTEPVQKPDRISGYTLRVNLDRTNELMRQRVVPLDEGANVGADVATFDDLPASGTIGELRYVVSENAYYQWQENEDENNPNDPIESWEVFSERLYDYEQGDGSKSISSEVSTINIVRALHNDSSKDGDHPFFTNYEEFELLPHVEEEGQRADIGQSNNEYGARILFYRGLQKGEPLAAAPTTDRYYPMASYHNRDYFNDVIGDYSLRWDGEYGLYEKWWKPWVDFRTTAKRFEWDIRFTLADMININSFFQQPVRIRENHFWIGRVRFDVSHDGIGPSRCVLFGV